MNDFDRRFDLFRRMRHQRSFVMRIGIAVVALPRLDELSSAAARRGGVALSRQAVPSRCLGRVSMNHPG